MSVFSSQIYEKTSEFKLIHVNHSYQYDYAAFHHSNLNWGPVTGLTQRGRTDKWTQKFRQASDTFQQKQNEKSKKPDLSIQDQKATRSG